MNIARTPLRLSLCGGSTDYHSWYSQHEGICLGGSINKYSYILCRYLPALHTYKSRLVYSEIELVSDNYEIKHRAISETCKLLKIEDGIEVIHYSDLPSKTGTGSSSSFIISLLSSLRALQGSPPLPPLELAQTAHEVETKRMGGVCGLQDGILAAQGGVNVLRIKKNGSVIVSPLTCYTQIAQLEQHLLLLYFSGSGDRIASDVAASYVDKLGKEKTKDMFALMRLAEEAIKAVYDADFGKLGNIIDASWRIKVGLSPLVTNERINQMYATARVWGAEGGKVIGAGASSGSGVLMLVVPPEKHAQVIAALPDTIPISFAFEYSGSQVIFASK